MQNQNSLKLSGILTYVFLAAAAITASYFVFISISLYGPGLTHDSAAYIYAAESLINGEGFEYFGYPSPFMQWPPLYPLLLALAGRFGIAATTASGFINAIAFGLIVLIAGAWLYKKLKNTFIAILTTIGLVFSLPLIQVSKYLWTETLFVLFTLLAFIKLGEFLNRGKNSQLAWAGVFSALACLSRYMGVVLVLTAAIFLFFRKGKFILKLKDIIIYGCFSSIPVMIWTIRNYIVSGTLVGFRIPSEYPFKLNVKRTMDSILSWLKPEGQIASALSERLLDILQLFSILLPVVIMILFIGVLIFAEKPKRAKSVINEYPYPILFNMVFVAIYVVYLILSATSVAFEPINSRYLVPIFVPLVIIVSFALDYSIYVIGNGKKIKGKKALAILVLLAYIAYPAINTVSAIKAYASSGAGGFSTRSWHSNGLISYAKTNLAKDDGNIYISNNADVITALTGVRTYCFPKRSGPDIYTWGQFEDMVNREENSYIIWFNAGVPGTLHGLEDVKSKWELETIEKNDAGAVYKILKEQAE
jgi:hypothetical protein